METKNTCIALENIIQQKNLPALFIGTGISKRYWENCPNWDELLLSLANDIGISASAFAAQKGRFKIAHPEITPGLLSQKMASYLQEKMLAKIENGELDPLSLFLEKENNRCLSGTDYFKMLVAKKVRNYSLNEAMKEELELFKKIGNKISMVFTTNYDTFLEREVFPEFTVYTNQNQYYFRDATYGEIYKIHGSVTDPNSIILCENDYKIFENSLKLISAKLINALLDFPIIFLGYSLEDENIRKILSDFVNSFDDKILQRVKKSLILISYDADTNDLIEGEKQFSNSGKSITVTTIKTNNFTAIYEYINRLQPTATSYELKKYKEMITRILFSAAKGEKTIYAKNLDKASDKEIAVYIAHKNDIDTFSKSTLLIDVEEILEKALFEKDMPYEDLAKDWYESKKIKSNQYVPTFHIMHSLTKPLTAYGEHFQKNYLNLKKTFNSLLANKLHVKPSLSKLNKAIEETYNKTTSNRQTKQLEIARFCWSTFLAGKISISEYQSILQELYNKDPSILQTPEFKKAISYLGYRLYE